MCLTRPERPILVPYTDRGHRCRRGMLIGGVADVRYGWRLTIGSSDRVAASVRQGGKSMIGIECLRLVLPHVAHALVVK
jgi:hypothetical protein